jgi:hypothetical protein
MTRPTLAPGQPASVPLGLNPEHFAEHRLATGRIGAVRVDCVNPANRDPPIDIGRVRDERLIPAVIDHQLQPQPLRVREREAIGEPVARHAGTSETALPKVKGLLARHPEQQPVDHPRARTTADHSGHVEEGHDAARLPPLIAVGDVPHLWVVGIHSLPDQPHPEQAPVELEIRVDVGGDRRDVMKAVNLHGVPHSCSIGANR